MPTRSGAWRTRTLHAATGRKRDATRRRRSARTSPAGSRRVAPFALLGYSATTRRCSCNARRHFVADQYPAAPAPLWTRRALCGTTGSAWPICRPISTSTRSPHLMAELFERHDRTRFETIGVSFGADDGSDDARPRLQTRVRPLHRRARARATATRRKLLRELRGRHRGRPEGLHRATARLGILAHRPAPIQVNYLGYPGTMGADFIDYIIADPVVAAVRAAAVLHREDRPPAGLLPGQRRQRGDRRSARRRAPRPACPRRGFVFCCFNNNYKITPAVFDVWMRLLRAVDGSVLWLLERQRRRGARTLRARRRRAASPRTRLVFAPRARMRRASRAASARPICSSTRCPTTRTPPRATRCGRDCRC